MPLGAREQELTARFLLAHPERIAVFIRQHRWEELAALADFAARDAPDALAQTDPALYRALRQQITDYRIRGWGQLNSGRLRELASKSGAPRSKSAARQP